MAARYYSQGQTVSGTKYFYNKDHLGSIRTVTNTSGSTVAQYSYDNYGQATRISGSFNSDLQYAGYYFHTPSGLNLTVNRAYNPSLGRWINRDPIEEIGGFNLYAYVDNNPISFIDPLGWFEMFVPCSYKDPFRKKPYQWTKTIFGRETGIQWYRNPNGSLTGLPYFGSKDSPNNLDMSPYGIPSWGKPIIDIHSHTWGDTSALKYYSPAPNASLNDPHFGLQSPQSPFKFSSDDIRGSENAGYPSLMIDPLGNVYQYSPFSSLNFDTQGFSHLYLGR